MDAGKYEQAIKAFKELNGYRDSASQITACEKAIKDRDYAAAKSLMDAGEYEEAIKAFKALNGYSDSTEKITACETAIKDGEYAAAQSLYDAGKYGESYAAFLNLKGYKDVDQLLTSDVNLIAAAKEPYTKVGNIVTYGHYEQDLNTNNGKEPIEWIVLQYDAENGKCLLLSLYALDARRFDLSTYQGWDMSEIRSWLNGTFLNNAFSI